MRTLSIIAAVALATSAAAVEPAEPYGKASGVIPNFVFGPRIAIVNVPTPTVGLEAKYAGVVGASFEYGATPTVNLRGVDMGISGWKVGAKVYPFRGRFFLGAAYGSRTLRAKKTDTSTGTAEWAKADVTSQYIAPELGWRFVWRSGFFTGIDLGWQLVVKSKTTLTTSVAVPPQDVKDVRDEERRIGKAGLPTAALLQLGWFF